MYIAKLNDDPDWSVDEAVHEAIINAMDAGHIQRDFGRFWVVDDHIVIDEKPVRNCFHPAIEKCGEPGELQFCPDCERYVGWEDL